MAGAARGHRTVDASPVLLGAFIASEARSDQPLVPLSLFRSRGLSTSGAMLALAGGAFLGMFFMTAIFMQRVRGLTALATGVELPLGLAVVTSAGWSPASCTGSARDRCRSAAR